MTFQVDTLVYSPAFGVGPVKKLRDGNVVVEFEIGKKAIRGNFLSVATPEQAATYTPPPKVTSAVVGKKLVALFKKGANKEFLDFILAEGSLIIELGDKAGVNFAAEYFDKTGLPVPPVNSASVRCWEDRWGHEYRVTFPVPPFQLPEICTSYQSYGAGGAGRLTINSKLLFWYMVEEGMRLVQPD
jgi:hypothetical protein